MYNPRNAEAEIRGSLMLPGQVAYLNSKLKVRDPMSKKKKRKDSY